MLFYNLLEDGNGDDLSLHASLPTVQGEKWLCNFWIWYVRTYARMRNNVAGSVRRYHKSQPYHSRVAVLCGVICCRDPHFH